MTFVYYIDEPKMESWMNKDHAAEQMEGDLYTVLKRIS
jgi:hypothetical protein